MSKHKDVIEDLKNQIEILKDEIEDLSTICEDRTEIINFKEDERRRLESRLQLSYQQVKTLYRAIQVFQDIVSLSDTRDKVLLELLLKQPETLSAYYFDSLTDKLPSHLLGPIPEPITSKIMGFYRDEKKIQAIKTLRDYTGIGLKEAKDIIDALWDYLTSTEGGY